MTDSFHVSTVYADGKGERIRYNSDMPREMRHREKPMRSEDEKMITQLPLHFIPLSNELKKDSPNPHVISSCLKSIVITLELCPFPFDKFMAFNVHEDLFKLINKKRSEEDILNALKIIGYYYCSIPEGCQVIHSSGLTNLLIQMLQDDENKPFLKPLFAALAGIIRFIPGFNEDFLSNHAEEQVIYLYDTFNENPLDKEVAMIIKALMMGQISSEFLAALIPLLRPLNNFVLSKQIDLSRLSIQAVRHLLINNPQIKPEIINSGYLVSIFQESLTSETPFPIFKTALYFLRIICNHDIDLCNQFFTSELLNSASIQIHYNSYRTEQIKNVIIDLGSIMLNDPMLTYVVIGSPYFETLFELAQKASFIICIECCRTLCFMVTTRYQDVIDSLMNNNFFNCLQQILTYDDDMANLVGLDALNIILEIYNTSQLTNWAECIKGQDWLCETISDLIENENEEIAQSAQYIFGCLSKLFDE
ncbi:hypothetical protein TRFO_12763 [Tritrichomonas foetus]|uniref:Uncharacterized protein n=1 Tax=Tritrichomonas foetus TaxID=1144522 RepID=A0A1J4L0L3_9EUKA|nr:hypothetical protein TRFO_12763 [Tritrichomonas foetus]|eukprot:OHT17047.1 hypothetical protein TRFO_12763 [Tritrichomonas foetus]